MVQSFPKLLNKPRKIFFAVIVVLILSLLVNAIIAFLLDFESLQSAFKQIRLIHIIIPFIIYTTIYFIDALRLKLVLHQFGYRIKFLDASINGLLGYFFAYLTPMATGGQPFQIFHLKNLGVDSKTSTNIIASRFVEYISSSLLISLLFIGPIIPFLKASGADTSFILIGFIASTILSIMFIILFIRPDWIGNILARMETSSLGHLIGRLIKNQAWGHHARQWALDLKESIYFLWKKRLGIVCLDVFLCILILGLQVFSLVWLLLMFGCINLNFFQIFVVILLLNLVIYYIPTPGASGGIESIFTLVLGYLTDNLQLSFLAVVIWRFATYYLQIAFGLVVFFILRRRGLFKPVIPSLDQSTWQ